MIVALFRRRWWLVQHRLLATLAFALMLPVLLHVFINMALKNVVLQSLNEVPYSQWVFPGFVLIISTLALMPLLARDFFDLRIHGKVLMNLTLAPWSKSILVFGMMVTALIEAFLFAIVGVAVLSLLMPVAFHWYDFGIMLLFTILFNLITGNAIVSLSLAADRVSVFLLGLMMIFLAIVFGSGLIIELEFYPLSVGQVLEYLPTSMAASGLHSILFLNHFDWFQITVPAILGILWTVLNGTFLKRKLNQ